MNRSSVPLYSVEDRLSEKVALQPGEGQCRSAASSATTSLPNAQSESTTFSIQSFANEHTSCLLLVRTKISKESIASISYY
jgi:hypothetical protein